MINNNIESLESLVCYEYIIVDESHAVDNLKEKLNTLYENPFSDITYINANNSSITEDNCFKLLISDSEGLKHLLLFKLSENKKRIKVLNECIKLSDLEIESIANVLFDKFKNVSKIFFHTLFVRFTGEEKKIVFDKRLSDMILDLPDSMDIYQNMLSTKNRKYFQYYKNRIAKELSGFRFTFLENKNITPNQIAQLVQMNRSRMKEKGVISGLGDTECGALYKYACLNGLLCLCYDQDQIIGGTICSVVGKHAFVHVLAHDDAYQKYSIGQIALLNTIQYLIEHKMVQAHLLWGESEYKSRLLCQRHDLYTVKVFKNSTVFYLNKIVNSVNVSRKRCISFVKKKLKKNPTVKRKFRKILKILRFGI